MKTLNNIEFLGIEISEENYMGVINAAKSYGWKYIAKGEYSEVYTRDNQILKIFQDDAYLAYLRAIKDCNNPFFPVIHGEIVIGNNLNFVVLEKLEPLHIIEDAKLANWLEAFGLLYKCADVSLRNNDRKEICSVLQEYLGEAGMEALEFICEFAKSIDAFVDIHEYNVMRKPVSGSFVFTDPVEPKHQR